MSDWMLRCQAGHAHTALPRLPIRHPWASARQHRLAMGSCVCQGRSRQRGLAVPDINQLSRHALHTAFLHSPIGIGVCDEDGRFLTISTSLARLLRRPPEAIIGRPFLTFVHPDARAASLAAYFEAIVATAAG